MKASVSLTHQQYREFADLCKAQAGQVLEVSTFDAMRRDWGQSEFFAWEVISDARSPKAAFEHHVSRIILADSVDVADFRRAGRSRPEVDWSVLSDEEIYPFIVWHEIGHRRDSFSMLDATFDLAGTAPDMLNIVRWVNEVLADRFAWSQVRPGEAIRLTANGKRDQKLIEERLAAVSARYVRNRYTIRPIEAGQYVNVSPAMLYTRELAAFVGPDVHPELVAHYIWKQANRLNYRTASEQPSEVAA